MVKKRGRAASVIGVALALFAALAISAQPASASSHQIGLNQPESSRCRNSAAHLCLFWYGDRTGAFWGYGTADAFFHGDPNLGDNIFAYGTGTGEGHVVRNNAAAMDCDYYVVSQCNSYYSPNYAGNYDFAYWNTGGTLYLTWNDEASVGYF